MRVLGMKVLGLIFLACAHAHQTEYYNLEAEVPPPPGESYSDIYMLEEGAGVQGDIVYRVSWNTVYDPNPAKTASKGTFKIEIFGVDGETTGQKELVTHPGYSCGAPYKEECYPDIKGEIAEPDECPCNPAASSYDENGAKWKPHSGTTQSTYIKAAEVSEITKIVVTGDNNKDDSWQPGFFKINMNDFKDGLGNGIYYIDVAGNEINKDNKLEKASDVTDDYGDKPKMSKFSSHKYGIIKCHAAACEESLDKMMTRAASKEEYESSKAKK